MHHMCRRCWCQHHSGTSLHRPQNITHPTLSTQCNHTFTPQPMHAGSQHNCKPHTQSVTVSTHTCVPSPQDSAAATLLYRGRALSTTVVESSGCPVYRL